MDELALLWFGALPILPGAPFFNMKPEKKKRLETLERLNDQKMLALEANNTKLVKLIEKVIKRVEEMK